MTRLVALLAAFAIAIVGTVYGVVTALATTGGTFTVVFPNGDTLPITASYSATHNPPGNALTPHTVTFGTSRSSQFTVTLTPGQLTTPTTTSTTSSTTSSSTSTTTTSNSSSTSTSSSSTTIASGACLQIPGPVGNAFENPLPASNYPSFAALDACGYPSPDTAGASGTLTTVSASCGCLPANVSWNASGGQLSVTGPATIQNVRIPDGYVVIGTSSPVTFSNDLIRCGGCDQGSPLINLQGFKGVTITHSTVGGTGGGTSCSSPASSDIGFSGAVLSYDVFDCSVEPINGTGYTLTNSYVIVDGDSAGTHNEAIYQPGGGSNDIEHNTLLDPLSSTAVIFMDEKNGAEGPTTFKGNLVAGAGYGDGAVVGGGANVTVTGNRFSGAYGSNNPGGVCSSTAWSSNYADGTLAPVALPVSAC